MAHDDLKTTIEAAWEARDGVKTDTKGAVRDAVATALDLLDKGKARVAEKGRDGEGPRHPANRVVAQYRGQDRGGIAVGAGGAWSCRELHHVSERGRAF